MLQQALEYLKKGKSVIPVGEDKKPLINWKEYQSRLATEEEVKQWWSDFPKANIGIVTGEVSGIAVVDIEKGGDTSGYPITLIAKTGGGGWHYYYKYEEGIENKARVLPLTDIRGEGGYVVAPPSKHASGDNYEWLVTEDIADFPKEMFQVKEKTDWNELVNGVSFGSRNETAAKIVGKLMSVFKQQDWETIVWKVLTQWNESNEPPLDKKELRSIYESIAKRASGNYTEADIDFITLTDVVERGDQELQSIDPNEVVSFGYEWLDDKLTGIFPSELIVLGGESGTGKTTFATNIIYKASQQHKSAIFALEDRLNDYGIKALYFEIGKIRARNGSKNYPWNAFRKNMIEDSFYEKIKNEAKENLKNDNVFFADVPVMMNIDLLEELIERKCQEGVSLFLIDHLHYFDFQKGDSSKADYIEQIMVRLKTLQRRTGAKIILVVHYRKLNGKKPTIDSFKDSISIVQNANYVINLWRDREEAEEENTETLIMIPKSRNPNGESTFTVEFDRKLNDYKLNTSTYGTPQEDSVDAGSLL